MGPRAYVGGGRSALPQTPSPSLPGGGPRGAVRGDADAVPAGRRRRPSATRRGSLAVVVRGREDVEDISNAGPDLGQGHEGVGAPRDRS